MSETPKCINVFHTCFNAKRGESVFIISDDLDVSGFFIGQAKEAGLEISLAYLHDGLRPLKNANNSMVAAVTSSNIVVLAYTPTPDETYQFRTDIIEAIGKSTTARLASIPGVNGETIECIMKTDYNKIEKFGWRLAEVLTKAKKARITSQLGSDLKMELGEWEIPADLDDGKLYYPRNWDNLPSGEACITPREGSAEGTLIVDGGLRGYFLAGEKKIVELEISDGKINKFQGSAGKEVKEIFRRYESMAGVHQKGNMYKISELGIGTNAAAQVTWNIVEFEKKLGTVHVAAGKNLQLGGTIDAPQHLDMVVMRPTLEIDGKKIIEDGKIELKTIEKICFENYKEINPEVDSSNICIRKSKTAKVYSIDDGKLYRLWYTPGGKNLKTKVGDDNTATLCARFMKLLKKEEDIKSLAKKMKISIEDCRRLSTLMLKYKVIEIA